MAVSWKRLIATVVLFAITLAGTPTNLMANDGLKSERYGLKSEAREIEVLRQTQANLNQNPFRNQTVTATLSGNAIRIEQNTRPQNSVAKLLTEGTTDRRSIAQSNGIGAVAVGGIHMPVFSNTRGIYSGIIDAGQSAMNVAGNLYDAAFDQVTAVALAEQSFADSITAAATRYGIVPVRPAGLMVPNFEDHQPVDQQPVGLVSIREIGVPAVQSSAVIKNITTGPFEARELKRRKDGNISIVVIQAKEYESITSIERDENFQVGEKLLIDRYLPGQLDDANPSYKPVAALAVPTMMIDHEAEAATITSNDSMTRAAIRSAKAFVKSVIGVIEPMLGIRRAMAIPRHIHSQLREIDELIFSSSYLKHVWNVCSTQK